MAVLLTTLSIISPVAFAKGDHDPNNKPAKNDQHKNDPGLIQADKLSFDQTTQTFTAEGHVEIIKDGQILRADHVTFNQETDIIKADGHVVLLQPSGEVLFAENAELTSDMTEGFVEKMGVLYPDNSRLTADNAERYQGRYLIASRGLYTACDCPADPNDPPIWQLRADKVTVDDEKEDVIYRDATVEFSGLPLIYTPYLSEPEPKVKRRAGFLAPSGGADQTLGTFVRTPYYYDISPDTDITVTPTFTTLKSTQLGVQWRERFEHASMDWQTTAVNSAVINDAGTSQGDQFRGSLFGRVRYDIDNTWRAGSDIALTTDKNYLSTYRIAHDDVLVNRGFVEGFSGRDYTAANLYYFQDTRPGAQLTEPSVIPAIQFSKLGEPGGTLGGRWSFDGSLLDISRQRSGISDAQQGPDTRRLGLKGGWQREIISSTGLVTNLSTFVREDGYWADNVQNPQSPSNRYQNVMDIRSFGEGDATVSYPLGRRGDGYVQTLEPIVMLTAAPRTNNNLRLPNEDSLGVEFDETNLFSENRNTGIDQLEGGYRGTYGLRQTFTADNGAKINFLGGQSYRLKQDDSFSASSGLRQQTSDYVGRIDFRPGSWFNANYGFRLDHNDLRPLQQELTATGGVAEFKPFVNYLAIDQALVNGVLSPLGELTAGFDSALTKFWSAHVYQTRALQPTSEVRVNSITISYQDECLQLGITAQRDNTQRVGTNSGDSIIFHFYLKNVGGLQTDSFNSPTFKKSEAATY